jgi:hypothetical protein
MTEILEKFEYSLTKIDAEADRVFHEKCKATSSLEKYELTEYLKQLKKVHEYLKQKQKEDKYRVFHHM